MPRGKDLTFSVAARKYTRPVKPHPGPYRVIHLCPVEACSQPLASRDGFIVCSADPEHFTQKVIRKC